MSALPKILISEQEYLDLEIAALNKNEYFKGEIFAMAGASPVHNRIVGNLNGIVYNHLKGKKCRFFPSDLRVYVDKYPLYTYPDLTIFCEKPEFHSKDENTFTNPSVIIEVLSPSTEHYDRTTKFALYRSLPSLNEYILVSSTELEVTTHRRMDGPHWMMGIPQNRLNEKISIQEINLDIILSDIYEDTLITEK
jgi:Uma2 family endonuclease